jgi:putative cell wall-binding protein
VRRWRGRVGGVLVWLLVAGVATIAGPAPKVRAQPAGRLVAPGVELLAFTRNEPGLGPQEVRVLRFHPDGARLSLRAIPAAAYGAARMRVSDLVMWSGALAAVNGNFFTPDGNVRGILVSGGRVYSEPEAPVNGAATPRAAWRATGDTVAFGRPGSVLRWHHDGVALGINGIERAPGYLGNPDEAVLVTSTYGPSSPPTPGALDVVLTGTGPLRFNEAIPATVAEVRPAPGPVPPGGAVVTATGANRAQIESRGVSPGDEVRVTLDVDDADFAAATEAGGGGPWIVHDGRPVDRAGMLGEGFSPTHLDRPAPRTAIGRTADGTVLLVTVDGRQPGRSVGATVAGLARIMVELGAVEAISLDGGGSTAMAVDGELVNVPSGEDATGRPGAEVAVADAVGVFFSFTPLASRRVAGADRVATAVAVSAGRDRASTALVATATSFPDALAGAPLAIALDAPLLLTPPDRLDPRVGAELARLGVSRVVLLGGPAALAPQVEADLAAAGVPEVRRLGGADRYETAALAAAEVARTTGRPTTVLVASGENFPDALAAGATGLPVLLTAAGSLPEPTRRALEVLAPERTVVVGGPLAVGEGVVPGAERVAGPDRFATATAVADWAIGAGLLDPAEVVVARGDAFPDALAGSALHRPVLLAARWTLADSVPTRDWLAAHAGDVGTAVLLGGRKALSTMTHVEVDALVAG